jgi:hypothetical protein
VFTNYCQLKQNLASLLPSGANLTAFDALLTGERHDYYVDYEVYTGIMASSFEGNVWRYGAQCYPATSKLAWNGSHYPAWGQLRFPDFVDFDVETGDTIGRTSVAGVATAYYDAVK